MGKRSEREERQERRNVSFSGAEERVAPFESAVRSFFPSSTWPPCVPARRCSDCKMRWLTYDSVPIPGEKDGDACVKTGSQLFNSRFAALVSLFRDSSSQQRSMTLFITWHAVLPLLSLVFSTLFLRSRISHSLSSPTFSKFLLFLLIYLPEKLNMDGYFFFFFAYVNFDLFLLLLFDNSRWALKNNETSINNWINTEFPWLKKCCLFSQLIRLFCALSTLINST